MRDTINVSSVIDNFYFTYRDTERQGLARNICSASLTDRRDKSHDFVAIAMNNAKFNDESAAVGWLKKYIH